MVLGREVADGAAETQSVLFKKMTAGRLARERTKKKGKECMLYYSNKSQRIMRIIHEMAEEPGGHRVTKVKGGDGVMVGRNRI